MKKFIAGVVVGACLFGAVPVFADSIKSLIGAKVEGVYSIEHNGQKIAEGLIINGSAYVPVRTMANVTNTPLSVEGRKIIMESDEKHNKRAKLETELMVLRNSLKIAETELLPPLYSAIEESKTNGMHQVTGYLEGVQKNIDIEEAKVTEYKNRMVEIEKELNETE